MAIYSPNKILHGNFKMREVAKSSTATRLGIDNSPSDKVLEKAEQVAIHILQPVRDEFGPFSPNSWFRCEDLEKVLTVTSFDRFIRANNLNSTIRKDAWRKYFERKSHPRGEAVDYEIAGVDNFTVFEWCRINLPVFDQLIAEFMVEGDLDAGWIHGSYSTNLNRHQIKTIQ